MPCPYVLPPISSLIGHGVHQYATPTLPECNKTVVGQAQKKVVCHWHVRFTPKIRPATVNAVTDGKISFIRDYRYDRYVADDAELVLAPDAVPPSEGSPVYLRT